MKRKCSIGILACLLFVAACNTESVSGPTVPPNQQFTLAPGQSISIRGTTLRLEFLRVSGDSRCPADAICVQAGDAIVHVRITDRTATEYQLHTSDPARAVVMHRNFRIELLQLQPYPLGGRTIEPGDYRATLTVSW